MKTRILLIILLFHTIGFSQIRIAESYSDEPVPFGPGIALGYSMSIPKQPLGFHVLLKPDDTVALLFEFRWGGFIELFEEYYEDITFYDAEIDWEDDYLGDDISSFTASIGLAQYVSRRFALWGAAGYSILRYYRQYYDLFEILGTEGVYWIRDRGKSELVTTLSIGFLIEMDWGMTVVAGYNSIPSGIMVGIGYMLRIK